MSASLRLYETQAWAKACFAVLNPKAGVHDVPELDQVECSPFAAVKEPSVQRVTAGSPRPRAEQLQRVAWLKDGELTDASGSRAY